MADDREEAYRRSTQMMQALRQDDDLWAAFVKDETEVAGLFFRERIKSGASPFDVLRGLVAASAQMQGVGVSPEHEADLLDGLHRTIEDASKSYPIRPGDPNVPKDFWHDEQASEFTQALAYLDRRVIEGAPSAAILVGMVIAASVRSSAVNQGGGQWDVRSALHSLADVFFRGGLEDRKLDIMH